MKEKKWLYYEVDQHYIQDISEKFHISPLVATVIYNRGIRDEEEIKIFLGKEIISIYDPFLLKGMDKAIKRINDAINTKEKITIYGDYDVDGVTSTSILVKYLRQCGAVVDYYIPDRIDEGYGVNRLALESIHQNGAKLVITVDTGITAIDEIKYAAEIGLDVIITDHHECKEEIPEAYVVINPKQPDCQYPFKELAGVGVAFKLIQGLAGCDRLHEIINDYCEIVCLGTIADVVPLLGENRLIVYHGLKLMQNTDNLALKALVQIAGINQNKINAGVIGFNIAPRINAAGRIGSVLRAVELFLCNDEKIAYEIARELDEENRSRQAAETRILDEAINIIDSDFDLEKQKIIVLSGENWHHGVIGIVASRITDKFYRPSILISIEGDEGKGSGRSIKGFNLFEALSECKDELIKYGGHELAAGLTINKENISFFKEHISGYANAKLTKDDLVPRVNIDCNIGIEHLNVNTVWQLNALEPFGMGNPGPIFALCDVTIADIYSVGQGKHLKLCLVKDGVFIDAIGFQMCEYEQLFIPGDVVDIACSICVNTYNGLEKMQLIIKDIRLPMYKQMEYKYYKTFQINAVNDIINNITEVKYQAEISNIIDNVNDNKRVLVLINTLSGALNITRQLCNAGFREGNADYKRKYVLHFNILDTNNVLDLLINPAIEYLDTKYYDIVYIYDPCFSLGVYFSIFNMHHNVYLLFDSTYFIWCNEVLDNIIPERQDFVAIYQYIKSRSDEGVYSDITELLIRRIYASYKITMNYIKLKNCLEVFDELGIMTHQLDDENITVKQCDLKGRKMNIENSSRLAKLRELRYIFNNSKSILNKKTIHTIYTQKARR